MNRYALGLGSNLGDRLSNLRSAYHGLESLGEVVAVSRLYESAPVGGPEQDPYLNAVLVLETGLGPFELLDHCQSIEVGAGRVRAERWGPRTLDIDIVARDGPAIDTDDLQVPHPRASKREFVLRPLADVWPDAPIGEGVHAADALSGIAPQGVEPLAGRWTGDSLAGTWLVVAQVVLLGAIGVGIAVDGSTAFGDDPLLRLTGVVMAGGGVALGWVAARALGPALVISPEPRAGANLVDHGPYRLVRHPVYGSVLLVVTGVALALGSSLGLAGVPVLSAFLVAKVRYEETRLRIRYPGYASYRRRVRGWFIPGVF